MKSSFSTISHYDSSTIKIDKIPTNYNFTNPFVENVSLKMPRNYIRKRTLGHISQQTFQNPQKLCLKPFDCHNRSSNYDYNPQKRCSNPGIFNNLSMSSIEAIPLTNSIEKIDATWKSKKPNPLAKWNSNPIVIGQNVIKINSTLERTWKQKRRFRDNGDICKKTLCWKQNNTLLRNKLNKTYANLYKTRMFKNS